MRKVLLCSAVLSYTVFLGSVVSAFIGRLDKRDNIALLVLFGTTSAVLTIALFFSKQQLKGDNMPKTKIEKQKEENNQQVSINQISVELNDIINPEMKLEDELIHLGFPRSMLEKLDENLKKVEGEGKSLAEHKEYFNEICHKKYRSLSVKCHPDKFLGSIKSIAREVGDERQKRLNAVSKAMKNLRDVAMRQGSYLFSYESCSYLSVEVAKSEKIKDIHLSIMSKLRSLLKSRQDDLTFHFNHFIINAEDIVDYYQKKLRVMVSGDKEAVEEIDKKRKEYIEKTKRKVTAKKKIYYEETDKKKIVRRKSYYERFDKIRTLDIDGLQEEYNEQYDEHYVSRVEYL